MKRLVLGLGVLLVLCGAAALLWFGRPYLTELVRQRLERELVNALGPRIATTSRIAELTVSVIPPDMRRIFAVWLTSQAATAPRITVARSDRGEAPTQVNDPACYAVRADAVLLPAEESWFDATADRRKVVVGVNPDCA